jgi:hypothetical protein
MAGRSLAARLWGLRQVPFSAAQKFALVLMAVGATAAAALPLSLLLRQWQVEKFMQVEARVTAVDERCNLLGKAENGRFEFVKTAACAETQVFLSSNAAEDWQVTREGFVTLDYVASGLAQSVTLPAARFDAENVAVGRTLTLHVDPNHLDQVETETTWSGFLRTMLFTLVSAGVAALGWFLFRWLTPELQPDESGDDADEEAAAGH